LENSLYHQLAVKLFNNAFYGAQGNLMKFFRRKTVLLSILGIFLSNFASANDVLKVNETLSNDQTITSPNGRYSLIMQSDGSLVMYRNDGTIRFSMAKHGTVAVMQADGNFVEYAGSTALWSTGTAGCCNHPGWPIPYLRITDDGNLRVESLGPAPAWQIGPDPSPNGTRQVTGMVPMAPPGIPPLNPPALPNPPAHDNSVQYNMNPRH
jgi:hypothetical protein